MDDDTVAERQLREQRPNISNRQELIQLMNVTRNTRRQWINKEHPSITEVLRRYPHFMDMNVTVLISF